MKISLIHPSRLRAGKALQIYNKWLLNSSLMHEIEHILSLDGDDPELGKYYFYFQRSKIVISANTCLVEAANNGAKHATGDLLVLISDDMHCPKDWDILLEQACAGMKDFVLKTYDGVQKWIVTLPIMDRTYYENTGYVYHPDYRHMFADTDLTHYADVTGKLVMRNDLLFEHRHYSTGKTHKDSLNVKADSTWDQGKKVYLDRVQTGFGLGDIIHALRLAPEASAHLKWLEKELSCYSPS